MPGTPPILRLTAVALESSLLDRHLAIVAHSFRVAGCVLGVPSLVALLFLLWTWLSLRPGPPVHPASTDIGKYGAIALLESGAYGVARIFQVFRRGDPLGSGSTGRGFVLS